MEHLNATTAATKVVFKYFMPERKQPYETYPVKITRQNADNQTVETKNTSNSTTETGGTCSFL